MDVVYATGDDWCGIYVDGVLLMQGHSIGTSEVLEWVADIAPIDEFTFTTKYLNDAWMDEEGTLPSYITDVEWVVPF